MEVVNLSINQGESGTLSLPALDETTDAYIEWSVWLRPGRDILFKDNQDVGGIEVQTEETGDTPAENIVITITAEESASLDPIRYNYEIWFTVDADRFLEYTGTLNVARHNVADSLDVFTSADDIRSLLGVTSEISTGILLNADVWVRTQMRSHGIGIPPTPDSGDDMRLAGAMIGCAFVIRSKESDKSWWQSINLAGASVSMSDAAQRWETSAMDIITAMAAHIEPLFEAVLYDDDSTEFS